MFLNSSNATRSGPGDSPSQRATVWLLTLDWSLTALLGPDITAHSLGGPVRDLQPMMEAQKTSRDSGAIEPGSTDTMSDGVGSSWLLCEVVRLWVVLAPGIPFQRHSPEGATGICQEAVLLSANRDELKRQGHPGLRALPQLPSAA